MRDQCIDLDKSDVRNFANTLDTLKDRNFNDDAIMIVLSQTSKKRLMVKFHKQYLTVGYQQRKVVKDVMEFGHDLSPMSQFDNQWQQAFEKYVQFRVGNRLGELAKKLHIFSGLVQEEPEEQICVPDQGTRMTDECSSCGRDLKRNADSFSTSDSSLTRKRLRKSVKMMDHSDDNEELSYAIIKNLKYIPIV